VSGATCSARPGDLLEYTHATSAVLAQLRADLVGLDLAIDAYLASGGWFMQWLAGGQSDPLWVAATDLDDLGAWVSHVAWAFAQADGSGDITSTAVVTASVMAINEKLNAVDWNPAKHLRSGRPSDWLRAFNSQCRGYPPGAGYTGGGFIEGPDGALYPLVAPYVTRDGVVYQANRSPEPDATSVLTLDGADAGWTTLWSKTGVERFRDQPGAWDRLMMGIGSTVAGRPNGSTSDDVEAVTLLPDSEPYIGVLAPRPTTEPTPPQYMEPTAPEFASPIHPETTYPSGGPMPAGTSGASMVMEGIGGAAMADLGSFDAYEVVFQRNGAGDTRALYKRVTVGFDDEGNPFSQSVWVTGPERNDQVSINYAP
jgi:hypothetical protein